MGAMDHHYGQAYVGRVASVAALVAALLLAGCAQRVTRDAALSARARSAIMATCGGDMVEDVSADSDGLARVALNVTATDTAVAESIASVTADLIFKGVPEVRRVAVRDSSGGAIGVFGRD